MFWVFWSSGVSFRVYVGLSGFRVLGFRAFTGWDASGLRARGFLGFKEYRVQGIRSHGAQGFQVFYLGSWVVRVYGWVFREDFWPFPVGSKFFGFTP